MTVAIVDQPAPWSVVFELEVLLPMTSPAVALPRRRCRACAVDHPADECRAVTVSGGSLLLCPRCGMVTGEVQRGPERPLAPELGEALSWPARGHNIVTWAALGVGVVLLGKVPMMGGLLSLGALWSYVFVVIRRGARGEDEAPEAADFQTWWDLAIPLMQGFTALLIPSLPFIGALYVSGAIRVLLGLIGVVWFVGLLPAALASTAYGGSFARALNPLPMIALVSRIPRDYGRTVGYLLGLFCGWLFAWWTAHCLVVAVGGVVPVFAYALGMVFEAALVYFPLAMARVIAVLLRERADELCIERLPTLSAR